jgi:hypothetical protein
VRSVGQVGKLAYWQRHSLAARIRYANPLVAQMAAAALLVDAMMVARRRDYGAEYRARLRRHPELPARGATGHALAGDYPPTASIYADDPPRFIELEGVSRRDLRRAGIYTQATRQLRTDLRSRPDAAIAIKRAFQRRFRYWRRLAGYRVLSDPDSVLAVQDAMRAGDVEVLFDSGRARPGRRRR